MAMGKEMRRTTANDAKMKALFRWHKLHIGVYARVAKVLKVDSSYVSRVANGKRQSVVVRHALAHELSKIRRRIPDA
jgi:hypothetical protein